MAFRGRDILKELADLEKEHDHDSLEELVMLFAEEAHRESADGRNAHEKLFTEEFLLFDGSFNGFPKNVISYNQKCHRHNGEIDPKAVIFLIEKEETKKHQNKRRKKPRDFDPEFLVENIFAAMRGFTVLASHLYASKTCSCTTSNNLVTCSSLNL